MNIAPARPPLIRFDRVSKRFRLDRQTERTVFDLFARLLRRRKPQEFFWPLQEVSFALHGGTTTGIIGENGSGKSTLLKLISRILEPTSGVVEINGRVSALLELGAGFHHELTGRENIFLHASLLGLQRDAINTVLDKIIAFADLGPFIDTPVKHYSSGMYARLGFAIAIYVEPDVLLVDEVLAVGDEAFQRRCLDAIHRLQARGVAIVLVSHSLNQVLELCDHCIWLDKGALVAVGETKAVVRRYLNSVDAALAQQLLDENSRRLLAEGENATDHDGQTDLPRRWGNGPLRIEQVQMIDENEQITWSFQPLTTVQIRLRYQSSQPIPTPIFSVLIHKLDGHYLWGSNTMAQPVATPLRAGGGEIVITIAALALTAGRYYLSVAAYTHADPPYWRNPSDAHDQIYEFQVLSADAIHGDLVMPHQWRALRPAALDPTVTLSTTPKAHTQPVTTP